MTQAWARLTSVTGSASGCTANRTAPAPTNGTTCAVVVAVHSAAVRLRRRSSTSGRQWTAWRSGRPSAAPGRSRVRSGSAARDRQAHDHELGVERQLAHLLGVALARRDHPEVALVELGAERADGGLDRLGIVGRPLGERRVAGVIHADETGHA